MTLNEVLDAWALADLKVREAYRPKQGGLLQKELPMNHCHCCGTNGTPCIGPDEAALLRHQLTFMTRPGKWGSEGKAAYHALVDGKPAPSALDDLAIITDRMSIASDTVRSQVTMALQITQAIAEYWQGIANAIRVCQSYDDGHRCTEHVVTHDVGART